MNTTQFVLMFLLALLAAVAVRLRARSAGRDPPISPPERDRTRPSSRTFPVGVPAAKEERPGTIEWHRPANSKPVSAPAAGTVAALSSDDRLARMRDRYITARFPGVFRGATDLLETEYVIKVARHCFEEGNLDRANELFALAIPSSPDALALRLARLEIAFLARETGLFRSLAREMHASHPSIAEWKDIARLGRALAPDEPLFAAQPGDRGHDQYGPWPDMPNWIQASWDLSNEVMASEFHRALSVRAAQDLGPALDRAA